MSVYEGVTLEDGVDHRVFTNVNNPRSEIVRKMNTEDSSATRRFNWGDPLQPYLVVT